MNSSGYMVEASLFSANGKMIACKHPDKDIMLIAGDDFDERKEVCDKIYARTGAADAKFRNESWGVIYQKAYELEYGTWKSSDYSVDLKRIFRDYSVSPYRACFDKTEGEYYSADIKRDYPSILMENTYRFPMYGMFDCIKPITVTSCDLKPGEYYVNKTFYMGLGTIKVSLGWYPYDFVISCLKLGYVDFSDITYGIVARKSLPADMFLPFLAKYMKDKNSKKINHLIGCFGSLYHHKHSGGVTTDASVAAAMKAETLDTPDVQLTVRPRGNNYFLQKTSSVMKDRGTVPIFRMVLCQGWLRLDAMAKAVCCEGTTIIGYNTDALKVRGNVSPGVVVEKGEDVPVGAYCWEDIYDKNGDRKRLTGLTLEELEEKPLFTFESTVLVEVTSFTGSGVIVGAPGSGKSYYLANTVYREGDTVLCFTNLACENLRKYEVDGKKIVAQTIDSFCFDMRTQRYDIRKFEGVKRVLMDEYTQTPPLAMSAILKAKEKYGFDLICAGVHNQCVAPVDDFVDYLTNDIFRRAVGCIMTLPYLGQRYDEALNVVRTNFLETGILDIKAGVTESFTNICWTNEFRHAKNKEMLALWSKGKELVKVGKMMVCAGMPVICYKGTDIKKEVYKTQKFVIGSITDTITLERENGEEVVFKHCEFNKLFDYSWCLGVGSIQGMTLYEKYNIWEGDKMSKNVMYTAISRGVKLSDVFVDKISAKYKADKEKHIVLKVEKTKIRTGRIYCIDFKSGKSYVGKTDQTLLDRLLGHREKPTNKAMEAALAVDGGEIRLLEEVRYANDKYLSELEDKWIKGWKGELLNEYLKVKVVVAPVVAAVVKTKSKCKIREAVKERRFEIDFVIDKVRIREKFPFGNDREAALLKATKRQTELLTTR